MAFSEAKSISDLPWGGFKLCRFSIYRYCRNESVTMGL
jgi:hypothetical protein